MADFNSSLPVRTESAGDVEVKLVDGTVTTQKLAIDTNGEIGVNNFPASQVVTATNLDIRDLSSATDSVAVTDGGGSITVDGPLTDAQLRATPVPVSGTVSVNEPVSVDDNGASLTVDANNLDIRDLTHATDSVKVGDGTDFLAVNADGSINVVVLGGSAGTGVRSYNTATALAAAASSNHDYTVTAAKVLTQIRVEASGSSKMKIEVQIETGVATNTFTTVGVRLNSTATPNMDIELNNAVSVAAGVRVRVIRTNRDNQAQDVYSTIHGVEN